MKVYEFSNLDDIQDELNIDLLTLLAKTNKPTTIKYITYLGKVKIELVPFPSEQEEGGKNAN